MASIVVRSARLAGSLHPRPLSNSVPAPAQRFSRPFSSAHGDEPPRVNCWEAPLKPAKWKEEHFVLLSLAGWGLLFYTGYKKVTGGGKEEAKV